VIWPCANIRFSSLETESWYKKGRGITLIYKGYGYERKRVALRSTLRKTKRQ